MTFISESILHARCQCECVCVCPLSTWWKSISCHCNWTLKYGVAIKWKWWCIDKWRYYKLRIWTKVVMLAHPFRHLDFLVWAHGCVENRWLLKLIGSSAIPSVWTVFFRNVLGLPNNHNRWGHFSASWKKQYTHCVHEMD